MITISICLTDLPKEKITTANNGKKYINLVVDNRKEKDKYDNTHTVYISQSKEERAAQVNKVYVGNGKEYVINQQSGNDLTKTGPTQAQQAIQQAVSDTSNDDLPF